MALNTWWTSDPAQRFWMEITTRPDIGGDLMAPQQGGNKSTQWSYSLTSLVQPGDVIFHYSTRGDEAGSIVGWSTAAGPAQTLPGYTWQARGTAGRNRGRPTTGLGWTVPLMGYTPLKPRLDKATIQDALGTLLAIRADLEATHGAPLYFPWSPYGEYALRAQQGYLTKFPAELLDVFKELAGAGKTSTGNGDDIPVDHRKSGTVAPHGRVTRAQDPILRAAIERHSLNVAAGYYAQQGGTDLIELGKPYDLRVTVDNVDRHAEVKGSSMYIDTVELTINEVDHAKDYAATDLIVVDGIGWTRQPNGSVETTGGAPSGMERLEAAKRRPPPTDVRLYAPERTQTMNVQRTYLRPESQQRN